MRLTITSRSLEQKGLSVKDFAILLYFMGGGEDDIAPEITAKLVKMNLIIPTLTGFEFNKKRETEIHSWYIDGNTYSNPERYNKLAKQMMELFPTGTKCPGHPWRSNVVTVAKKLETLHNRFSADFTDEQVLEATKKYVASFNGDYTYMQCLNYFILKRDLVKMEDTSALLSYIENGKDAEFPSFDNGELR